MLEGGELTDVSIAFLGCLCEDAPPPYLCAVGTAAKVLMEGESFEILFECLGSPGA